MNNPRRIDIYAPSLPPVLPPIDLRAQFSPWWGATSPSPTVPASTSVADTVAEYAPYLSLAKQVFTTSDPREEAALLEQRIANYTKMKSIAPYNIVPGKVWYENEIAKMQVRLKVLRGNILPEQQRTQVALEEYQSLGRTVLGIGAVLGIALVGLVVAKTIRTTRGS